MEWELPTGANHTLGIIISVTLSKERRLYSSTYLPHHVQPPYIPQIITKGQRSGWQSISVDMFVLLLNESYIYFGTICYP